MFTARNNDNYEGFTVAFTNGWTVSVQFGKHTYCNRRDLPDINEGKVFEFTPDLTPTK